MAIIPIRLTSIVNKVPEAYSFCQIIFLFSSPNIKGAMYTKMPIQKMQPKTVLNPSVWLWGDTDALSIK